MNAPDIAFERGLPASIDAERAILGGVLLYNELFFEDLGDLTVEDFALDSHQKIFNVINLIMNGMTESTHVDIFTLSEELARRKEVDAIGGVAYLASLTEGLPRRISVDDYVKIVKSKALLRRVIGVCSDTINRAADQSDEAKDVVTALQSALSKELAKSGTEAVRLGEITASVVEDVKKSQAVSSEHTALGLTWGIEGLDNLTKGLFGGEWTVLAGESGGAKTSLAVQMTLANSLEGTPCLWISLDLPREKVTRRYFAAASEIITAEMMRDPRLMNLHTHIPGVDDVTLKLNGLPIWIDDATGTPINKLVSRIRMWRRKYGDDRMCLCVIDYAQLIYGTGRKDMLAQTEVAYGLRDMHKVEPMLHTLVLSQYAKVRGRKIERTKEDISGPGALHHAAPNVALLKVESPKDKHPNDLLEVEIDIVKQRDGRVGKVDDCRYDRDHLLFVYPQATI